MTSPRQKAENSRNAERSTGPKSEAGRRMGSVNALKHGLSSSVDSTIWGSKVADLEALLKMEGLDPTERLELPRRLVDFERNVNYQRQRFLGEVSGEVRQPVMLEGTQKDFEVAAQIAYLRGSKQTHLLGMDRPLAREMQKFFKQIANRDAARELKNADRYLRRAANQLIKQLKSLGDN